MSHQERNRRLVHEIVGDAAEQPFAQAQMTLSAHDDKVGLAPFRLCDQSSWDFSVPALDAMMDGVDPVVLEMIDNIETHDGFLFGWPFICQDHGNQEEVPARS